jgi:hypothetical protein
MNDGILSAVGRFSGETPQRDDQTLVTVKRVKFVRLPPHLCLASSEFIHDRILHF